MYVEHKWKEDGSEPLRPQGHANMEPLTKCLKLRKRTLKNMNNWWDDEIPNEALKERKRTITFGEPMFCLSLNQGGANVIIGGSQQVWK